MRLISTRSLQAGMKLAKSIYNENGIPLLSKGVSLTDKTIQRLIRQGVSYVYIEDKATEDIVIESAVSEELRIEATQEIKEIFHEISNAGLEKKSFLLDKQGKKMGEIVKKLLAEIQQQPKQLSMLADIFVTDQYVFQHSLNVTIYSLALGISLQFPQKKLLEIGVGSLLHDIGKIFIDQKILNKKGRLTDEEFEVIKTHTELGFDFLRQHIEIPSVVAHCAYEHHERLDGSGYPRGIKKNEIHPYGKLIAITDVFDAVTSNRIYRDAMLPHEGLEILYAGSISQFDKHMVEEFKKSIIIYPNGLQVELSDGRKGVILRQNPHLNERPVVRVLSEDDQPLKVPYEIDLKEELDTMIVSVMKE